MWTSKNRAQYERGGRYPSDLTDEEWALVEPHLPPQRAVDRREIMNAILYVLTIEMLEVPATLVPPVGQARTGEMATTAANTTARRIAFFGQFLGAVRWALPHVIESIGRSERIRTSDPLLPKQVRYQAALRSDPTLQPPGHEGRRLETVHRPRARGRYSGHDQGLQGTSGRFLGAPAWPLQQPPAGLRDAESRCPTSRYSRGCSRDCLAGCRAGCNSLCCASLTGSPVGRWGVAKW